MRDSVALVVSFPLLSSAFAAAASVSKARCEVDAEAACQVSTFLITFLVYNEQSKYLNQVVSYILQAASTLALEHDSMKEDDPVLRPFKSVVELIRLAVNSGWRSVRFGILRPVNRVRVIYRKMIVSLRWNRRWRRKDPESVV